MVDEPRYRSERETVTDTGVDMVAQELTKGTGGNVSARTDDGNVVISPPRASPTTISIPRKCRR